MKHLHHYLRLVEGDEGLYDFHELTGEIAMRMASEFLAGTPSQPWKVVPAAKLIAIWKQAARTGVVRNGKGLDDIAAQMIENVARLVVNTEIAGHETGTPEGYLRFYGIDEEIDDVEAFVDWAVNLPTGGWRISDYGLRSLVALARELIVCTDDMQKLVLIDRMLNITHQRSDLASWFVEGGTATLNRLKNE